VDFRDHVIAAPMKQLAVVPAELEAEISAIT
jgi:hypothetical protein